MRKILVRISLNLIIKWEHKFYRHANEPKDIVWTLVSSLKYNANKSPTGFIPHMNLLIGFTTDLEKGCHRTYSTHTQVDTIKSDYHLLDKVIFSLPFF